MVYHGIPTNSSMAYSLPRQDVFSPPPKSDHGTRQLREVLLGVTGAGTEPCGAMKDLLEGSKSDKLIEESLNFTTPRNFSSRFFPEAFWWCFLVEKPCFGKI